MSPEHGSGLPDRSPSDPPPVPPELLACPDYEVIRELGRGGMGVVYLARNRLMDRFEALKVLPVRAGEEPLLREVQAAARLSHPNIVAAYSAKVVDGAVVLAMEYVDGEDLHRQVTARGPLPITYACECARQAAVGLQHALDRGVIHRDIKPSNLIVSRAGGRHTVKILDFGLAVCGRPPAFEALGTPAFAAPEQTADPGHADIRSDIYALGGTLHFLLTGDPPFVAGNVGELLRKHREDEPPPVDAVRPGVPPDLAEVVARMLAKDPADRFQTPAEVAAALAPFAEAGTPVERWVDLVIAESDTAAGQPTTATAEETPRPDGRLTVACGRGRRRLGPGLVAVGVLVVGLGGLWSGSPSRSEPETLPGAPAVGPDPGRPAEPPRPPRPVKSVPALPAGFVPLFDGESLSGWVVDGGDGSEWRVEQGAIVTSGTLDGPRGWLLTAGDYGDCRVRFEYRLAPRGNSGLAFRAVPGERPVFKSRGGPTPGPYHQQIELSDDSHPDWKKLPTGQVNGSGTLRGAALRPEHPARLRPDGEWNTMEVEFRGQQLRVAVNGEEVLSAGLDRLVERGSPYPALGRPRGRLGLQQSVGRAEFRNIGVQELPPAGTP